MKILGDYGVDSILLEGGGTLNEAALEAGIVKTYVYIAPKIIGGKRSCYTPVEGKGIEHMNNAFN